MSPLAGTIAVMGTSCPIEPIQAFSKHSWAYYRGKSYEGPFNVDQPIKLTHAILMGAPPVTEIMVEGVRWLRMTSPQVNWIQGSGDANCGLSNPAKAKSSPRHFHADICVGPRSLHIDFLKFVSWGPLTGVLEFLVFQGGECLGRGGSWGQPPAGGQRNWPFVVMCGDILLTITYPFVCGMNDLQVDGLALWERDMPRAKRTTPT